MDVHGLHGVGNEKRGPGDGNVITSNAVLGCGGFLPHVHDVDGDDGGHDGPLSHTYGPHVCQHLSEALGTGGAGCAHGNVLIGLSVGLGLVQRTGYLRSVGSSFSRFTFPDDGEHQSYLGWVIAPCCWNLPVYSPQERLPDPLSLPLGVSSK